MKTLFSLFISFAKIGVMTFGGGYAMLPMMSRVVAGQKKWATEEELLNYYAMAQCTPGVMAVNTATFVGAKQKGVAGGIAATLGVIFPGVAIIILLAVFLSGFSDNQILQNAFKGIRIAAAAIVTLSAFRLAKTAAVGALPLLVMAAAFAATALASPAVIALSAVVAGVVYAVIKCRGHSQ